MDIGHFDALRFMDFIRKQGNGCWLWMRAINDAGTPVFCLHGKTMNAHRVSYEMKHGPIPAGVLIVRTCETPGCVAPEHLKATTMHDYLQERGLGNAGRTHCGKGHSFTAQNTRVDNRGRRICKACERLRMRNRRAASLTARGSVIDSADLDKVS